MKKPAKLHGIKSFVDGNLFSHSEKIKLFKAALSCRDTSLVFQVCDLINLDENCD